MNITINKNGDELYAAIFGQMNAQTSPMIEVQLVSTLDGAKAVTLDLAELEYISSAGLRVLLTVMQYMDEHNSKLTVKNVRPEIMSILELTGFSANLNIHRHGHKTA